MRDVDELTVLRLAVAQHQEVAARRNGLQLVRARLSAGEVDHRDLAFRIRLLFAVIGPEIEIRVDEVRIVAAVVDQRAGLPVAVAENEGRAFVGGQCVNPRATDERDSSDESPNHRVPPL